MDTRANNTTAYVTAIATYELKVWIKKGRENSKKTTLCRLRLLNLGKKRRGFEKKWCSRYEIEFETANIAG